MVKDMSPCSYELIFLVGIARIWEYRDIQTGQNLYKLGSIVIDSERQPEDLKHKRDFGSSLWKLVDNDDLVSHQNLLNILYESCHSLIFHKKYISLYCTSMKLELMIPSFILFSRVC